MTNHAFPEAWRCGLYETIARHRNFSEEGRRKDLSVKLKKVLDASIILCITCNQKRFGSVVIGRNTILETAVYSTCCAIQNLWLSARAKGIGVGWMSIMELGALRKVLGMPYWIVSIAYLFVGFVASFPERPALKSVRWLPRIPLQDLLLHDQWTEQPRPDLLRALEANQSESERPSERWGHGAEGIL